MCICELKVRVIFLEQGSPKWSISSPGGRWDVHRGEGIKTWVSQGFVCSQFNMQYPPLKFMEAALLLHYQYLFCCTCLGVDAKSRIPIGENGQKAWEPLQQLIRGSHAADLWDNAAQSLQNWPKFNLHAIGMYDDEYKLHVMSVPQVWGRCKLMVYHWCKTQVGLWYIERTHW